MPCICPMHPCRRAPIPSVGPGRDDVAGRPFLRFRGDDCITAKPASVQGAHKSSSSTPGARLTGPCQTAQS